MAAILLHLLVSSRTSNSFRISSRALRQRAVVRMGTASKSGDAVVVYSTAGCQYCVRAKGALDAAGVDWVGVDVGGDPDARRALADRVGGVTSVPQIFAGESLVGGFDDLQAALADGSFLDMVTTLGLRRKTPVTAADFEDTADGDASLLLEGSALEGGALNVLNDAVLERGDFFAVAQELQARSLRLFDECVKPDGSGVDYARLRTSPRMREFVQVAAKLASPAGLDDGDAPAAAELAGLSPAFWINLYNAMVMHANVVVGHPRNPEERSLFFSGASGARYRVGPFLLSLDDIEHGILRGSPAKDPRAFKPDDPRRVLAVREPDPRIHFALNCGAKSCPPISLFTADGLKEELKAVTEAFVSSDVSLDDDTGAVNLSKIFLWYVTCLAFLRVNPF